MIQIATQIAASLRDVIGAVAWDIATFMPPLALALKSEYAGGMTNGLDLPGTIAGAVAAGAAAAASALANGYRTAGGAASNAIGGLGQASETARAAGENVVGGLQQAGENVIGGVRRTPSTLGRAGGVAAGGVVRGVGAAANVATQAVSDYGEAFSSGYDRASGRSASPAVGGDDVD